MTAVAKYDRGSFDILYLPKKAIINTYEDYAYGNEVAETLGNNMNKYGIIIGKMYNIYGVLSYGSQNRFLIRDELNDWSFIPCELFEICDNNVDKNWQYNQYMIDGIILSVISYSCITNNYNSLIRLIEGDPTTIQLLYNDVIIPTENE